jgi:hypothetical protein
MKARALGALFSVVGMVCAWLGLFVGSDWWVWATACYAMSSVCWIYVAEHGR